MSKIQRTNTQQAEVARNMREWIIVRFAFSFSFQKGETGLTNGIITKFQTNMYINIIPTKLPLI